MVLVTVTVPFARPSISFATIWLLELDMVIKLLIVESADATSV